MVRTGPQPTAPHDFWGQIGVSACVLLVPPIVIGTAVYAMLPVHGDRAAPSSSLASAPPQPAPPLALSDGQQLAAETRDGGPGGLGPAVAAPARPAIAAAKAATSTTRSAAPSTKPALSSKQPGKAPMAAPAAAVPAALPAAAGGMAMAGADPVKPDIVSKDVARALGPVPVQVTIMVAPKAAPSDGGQPALRPGDAATAEAGALPASAAPLGAAPPSAALADEPAQEFAAAAGEPTIHSHFRHSARHVAARQKGQRAHDSDNEHAGRKGHGAHPVAEAKPTFSLRSLFSKTVQRNAATHN
jgi:hypothetical protein